MRRSSVAALLVVIILILFVIDQCSEEPPIRASETPTTISAPRRRRKRTEAAPSLAEAAPSLPVPTTPAPSTADVALLRRAARVYSPDMFESEADAPPAAFRSVGGNPCWGGGATTPAHCLPAFHILGVYQSASAI